ncbi:MAG: nuclear transport factor 2 family protein [Ilumatobacteraceae bacterium]
MSTREFDPSARGGLPTLPRRSFLQFGGTGLALGAVMTRGGSLHGSSDQSMRAQRRRNEELVQRLLNTIETGSTSAIWSFFADDGVVEFPFTGARYTDFASFDAALAPFFAALVGFTYTLPLFEPLDDPNALIAKYKAHASINFTGKMYDQTYITEVHVRHGKVASWAEYFDTAVLNEAFTP